MVTDKLDRTMVEAINQVGHSMNIETIAEFVEDEKTLEAVRETGIDYAQGYVIAKPAPLEIALQKYSIEKHAKSSPADKASLKSVSGE
jgi:EAL domain-containing protein (putative c-di-GMP-specific phosphodiesterase class I)